jgi:hypothetical protein
MNKFFEAYNSYVFPVLAVIFYILLWRFKKEIMKNYPGSSFIETVMTKKHEINQSLLNKYIVASMLFGIIAIIFLIGKFL